MQNQQASVSSLEELKTPNRHVKNKENQRSTAISQKQLIKSRATCTQGLLSARTQTSGAGL